MATKAALKMADYVITEAGFGADLGAEKFLNIKARGAGLKPGAVVIVATIRALKLHGGQDKDHLSQEDLAALKAGFVNLQKHTETIAAFGLPFVAALNRFYTDSDAELALFNQLCQENNIPFALTEVWEKGGAGGRELAEKLLDVIEQNELTFKPLYDLSDSLEEKMKTIAQKVYGAKDVELTPAVKKQLQLFEQEGWGNLPICMAKTQYSLSDDPTKFGRPEDFTITVREVKPSIGAGFIVALTGNVMTMPGLPKKPAALNMDIDEEYKAKGLF